MLLDSDERSPNGGMSVEFYTSREKGYEGRAFVRISAPGQAQLHTVDTFVREDHKERFPRQWLYFQMQNAGAPIEGTPLQVWQQECPDDISEYQVAELGILKFQTVEQLATASDGQRQRIGMGADGLANLARAYLKRKRMTAGADDSAALATAKTEIADMRAMLAKQGEQMAELMSRMTKATPARRSAGRPRKNPAVAIKKQESEIDGPLRGVIY